MVRDRRQAGSAAARGRHRVLHCGPAPARWRLLALTGRQWPTPSSRFDSVAGTAPRVGWRLKRQLQREKQNSPQDFPAVFADFSSVAASLRRRHPGAAPQDNHSAALPPLRPRMERTLRRSFDLLAAKVKDFGCVSFRLAAQFVRIVR